jgi:sugar lactone lactonase YvrE
VDSAGELYIADYNNNVIRLVGTNGLITRVAGNGSVPAGYSGDGGQATGALLNGPAAVAVDGAGNFYIADYQNSVIRQVDGNGLIRTVAGNYALGGSFSGDGGAATNAGLYKPNDLILDGAGNIYIADSDNSVVRKVDEKGMITTVVGGYNGRGSYAGDGGAATNAGLDLVEGVALDGSGNLYIADYYNNLIRRVSMTYTNFTYTNGALMITDAQPTNAGLYDVIITGVGGSVTSSVAPLIIVYPPAIASQPASQTVINGGTAAFAVAATGTDPFSYQWQFDGTNLTDGGDLFGSATTNLVVGGATAADAGQYDVIITNAWGSVTSSVVVLNIAYPPAITNQPVSQTIINGSNAVFSVGAAGTDALGYQWQFNGVNLTDGGNISGSVTPILTLTPAMGANAGGYDAIITNAWGSITSSVAALTIVYPPAITNQPVSESVVVGVVASLAVTATGTGPLSYQWQFNGMDLTDGAGISGSATTNLVLTPANANEAGAYDVVIANAWGSVTSSVAALTITYPPSITNEPVSQTVVNLSRTTFTVAATGTAPLAYQWQFNGVNLLVNNTVSGTTTPTLVLAQVTAANTGNYDVVVANAWGSVTSSVAALTIVYAPAITQQPTNQLLLAGGNANFGAVASGTPPLFYQWQFNGTNLSDGGYFSGSATTNLLVTQVTAANAGNYDIVITNAWGSVTSSIASLTIASPPIITLQPTNESVIVGANGSFQVLAAGTLPLHFQWLINGGAITNRNVQSANTDRLFFDPVQTTNAGTYEVVITNAWGSVTSSVASLTVLVPPTITSQPSNQTAAVSTAVTFSVGVSGTGPFTYQWTYNQRDLPVTLITTIAGTNGSGYSGDGGAATNARLNEPAGLALDGAGSVFIADQKNERIRKINAAGIITTVAGNGNLGYSGNGLAATNSPLSSPAGVAVDAEDNLFIADSNNQRVRTVTFNIMLSIAGDGVGGYSGDGGAAYNAKLYLPSGVAVDADGNIYIADTDNHCIRKVDINDTITTVAGTGKKGFSGDGGAATNASLFLPGAVAVDGAGNLFIADTGNERIRKVDANGIITTVAGKGSQGYNGDGGAATNATFGNPAGVAVDTSGNFYVADTYNDRIRKVNSNGIITTVAGHGTAGFGGDGGAATNALLAQPAGVAVDGHGNLFIAETGNSRIREVTTQGPVLSFTAATTNAGSYSVIITGPGGTVTSTVAVLTVVYPPSIVQTPASQTVIEGTTVQLGVSVSGSDPFYYHWQFNGTNLANGGQITGATASTLTLTQVTTNNAGRYAVIVTNTFGSVTSSIVTLTVNLPQIFVISATNGGVTLNFLTAANVSSRVLTATNLIPPAVWVSIYTNRPGTNGFWQFTDTNNSLFPERFYRTSTP